MCTAEERSDDQIREMLGMETRNACEENFGNDYDDYHYSLKGKNGTIWLTDDELYELGYSLVDVFGGIIKYYEMGDEKGHLNEIFMRVFENVFTTKEEIEILTRLCFVSDTPFKEMNDFTHGLYDNLTDEEQTTYRKLLSV